MKKCIALLLLFPMGIVAQNALQKRADQKFNKESYVSAIAIYERLANKGIGSEEIYEKLGDANYFNAEYIKAEQWYSKRYELKGTFPKEFLYRYGQSLKTAGKQQQSQEILAQYAKENPSQLRAKKPSQALAQQSIKKGSDVFTIQNININSKYSDYSSSLKGDTLLFASARPISQRNQIYARTGQPFTNLYYSVKQSEGNYSKPELFSKSSFTVFHEASPVFTPDGNTMYYTQNEVKENSKKRAVDGLYKIYKSVKVYGKWKNLGVQDIFAEENARVAHPGLSPDGNTLYFASDARGSFGQSDIFKVTINSDGSYTAPENLGNIINTEGRESYPYVTKDNILLFASDGHPGQGGFDLYAIDLSKQGSFPVRLEAPLNSAYDDFGLNWDRTTHKGVFTSNRPGGQGDDDLYVFSNTKPLFEFDYSAKITGKVVDKAGTIIPDAQVVLYDRNGKQLARTTTNEAGEFVFDKVASNATYKTQASKTAYGTNETSSSLALYEREANTTIVLEQNQFKIEEGLDLGKALSVKHIYFDVDKSEIREDAKVELEKIVMALEENPKLRIIIGSHTDSRQTEQYNLELSQRRAKSTLDYLVESGIAESRLTAKGYGETKLVNKCSDGVNCTEDEHQLNRRSTFVIEGK
jgi:outer membrane protein OmpA-like peptidoglycan-associated protein